MTNWGAATYYCAKCGDPDDVFLKEPCAGPDRCGICVFWDVSRDAEGKARVDLGKGPRRPEAAHCKRRSPTLSENSVAAEWPYVDRDDLCGDFKRRGRHTVVLPDAIPRESGPT